MPTVPRAQSTVQEQGIPGARFSTQAPLEAFGGGPSLDRLSGALEKFGETAVKIAEEEKKKANDARDIDSENLLSQLETRLLYDKDKGALHQRGENSFELPDKVLAEYDKDAGEIGKDLTDEQQVRFRQRVANRRNSIDRSVQQHVAGEARAHANQVTDSLIANEMEAAASNYSDPARIGESLARQQDAIAKKGFREGWDGEVVKAQQLNAASKTHTAVLSQMLGSNLAGSDQMARNYFKANQESFTEDDRKRAQEALERGTLLGEAQRTSDKILLKNANMSSALAVAKDIDDPELRKATTEEITRHFSLKDSAERESAENLNRSAASMIDQGMSFSDVQKKLAFQWNTLTTDQRSNLRRYAETKAKGIEPSTNWGKYYDIKSIASVPETRAEFMRMDLMDVRHDMADPEFKELVNLQTGLRNNDGKAEKILDGYRTDAQIVNDALASINIDPTPRPGSNHAKRADSFRRRVDEDIRSLQERTGKKATNEEVQAIVDGLLVKGITQRNTFWFDTEKRVFELGPGEQIEIAEKDIPQAERAKIEAALRKHGRPVTAEAVRALYQRKVGGMGRASQ